MLRLEQVTDELPYIKGSVTVLSEFPVNDVEMSRRRWIVRGYVFGSE